MSIPPSLVPQPSPRHVSSSRSYRLTSSRAARKIVERDHDLTLWFLDNGADPNRRSFVDLTPTSVARAARPATNARAAARPRRRPVLRPTRLPRGWARGGRRAGARDVARPLRRRRWAWGRRYRSQRAHVRQRSGVARPSVFHGAGHAAAHFGGRGAARGG